MNKHVESDDLPVLTDVDAALKKELRTLIDSGYVWVAVSKGGIRATYSGYRFIVDTVELLLTEENPHTYRKLLRMLADAYNVQDHIIKRAIIRGLHAASFREFRKHIFDARDRAAITAKVFPTMNAALVLSYFVSHCVDYAETELAKKQG